MVSDAETMAKVMGVGLERRIEQLERALRKIDRFNAQGPRFSFIHGVCVQALQVPCKHKLVPSWKYPAPGKVCVK